MRSIDTDRRPSEDWAEYIKRLEVEHLRAIGRHKQKEAEALESIPEERRDAETRTTARAKRAAAEEFFRAVQKMEGGDE